MLNESILDVPSRRIASRRMITKFGHFAVVGVIATGIQYGLLMFLVRHVTPVLASDIGFVASAVVNYLLNYHLTFRSTKAHTQSGPRFVMVASLGLLLNSVIMHIGTDLLGLHHVVTQIVATAGVAMWNFTGHHVWSFGVESMTSTAAGSD